MNNEIWSKKLVASIICIMDLMNIYDPEERYILVEMAKIAFTKEVEMKTVRHFIEFNHKFLSE